MESDTPVLPYIYIKVGCRGCKSHRFVILMFVLFFCLHLINQTGAEVCERKYRKVDQEKKTH